MTDNVTPWFIDHLQDEVQNNYQIRVHYWMMSTFGEHITYNLNERNYRFLEEALELVQSTGLTKNEAIRMVNYVYSRPKGEIHQEAAGTIFTLTALCTAYNINLVEASEKELKRAWEKQTLIREKQKTKPKSVSVEGTE